MWLIDQLYMKMGLGLESGIRWVSDPTFESSFLNIFIGNTN